MIDHPTTTLQQRYPDWFISTKVSGAFYNQELMIWIYKHVQPFESYKKSYSLSILKSRTGTERIWDAMLIEKEDYSDYLDNRIYEFVFKHQHHAILFKLRWGTV